MKDKGDVFDFSQIYDYIDAGRVISYAFIDYDKEGDCLIFKVDDDVFILPRIKLDETSR